MGRTSDIDIRFTFEPVALPELAGSDALEAARLEVRAARHRPAVYLIHHSVLDFVRFPQCTRDMKIKSRTWLKNQISYRHLSVFPCSSCAL